MSEVPPTLRTTLGNGLTVLIRESHRVPVASFWVWYRVGARNEVPGITGISHWVEHMLFKGTPTWKVGEIFRTVNKHGGTLNGFTWLDYTAYFETLPSAEILLGADIESDRMRNAVFDPADVQSERTVILSERQGNENQPTFFLREEVNAASFRAHPYGQGVIGFTSDLQQITRDDLYRHYQTYYAPNNATVVVVGDVDAQQMLHEIERRFGGIAPSSEIPAVRTIEPPQQGQRRVSVRRPAPTATILATWHAPAATSPDAPAMDVLDTVLSGGKSVGFGGGGGMGRSSRLYRALVASGLTSSAGSSFSLSIDPYLFSVSATLVPATEPTRVEQIIFQEIARLREEPVPEEELARAIKQIRAQFAYAHESVTSQASWLGSTETVAPGTDPDELLERIYRITPDDVRRVAQKYLPEQQSTVGWLEPTGASGTTEAGPAAVNVAAARPYFFSDAEPSSPIQGPELHLQEQTLGNGMRVLGNYDPTSAAIVIDMRLPAGAILDGGQPGLAWFTGRILSRGSEGVTFAELNEELDNLGAAISVGVGREFVDVTGKSLKEDAARLAELMAKVVRHPTFPEDEIERVRDQALTALRQALDDARSVADQTLRELIYPEGHPYRHRVIGNEETLRSLSRADFERFHRLAYRPDGAIVAVAGGLPVNEARAIVDRCFGDWRASGEALSVVVPNVEPPKQRTREDSRLPGKTQADLALGLPAVARDNPDYEALRVANLILGRLGLMGRLGASVRERQGMAYHASSSLSAGLARGVWAAHAGVDPANIDRAIDSIVAEVERMRQEPVTAEELADAKSYLIGSLPLGLETSDAIAGTALDIAFYHLGLGYVETLPARIAALTADELRAVSERYLLPEHLAISVARPAGTEES